MRCSIFLSAVLLSSSTAWAQWSHGNPFPSGISVAHGPAAASSIQAAVSSMEGAASASLASEVSAWLAHASSYKAAHYPPPQTKQDPEVASWKAHASSYKNAHYRASSSMDSDAASWLSHAKSHSKSLAQKSAKSAASASRASASRAGAPISSKTVEDHPTTIGPLPRPTTRSSKSTIKDHPTTIGPLPRPASSSTVEDHPTTVGPPPRPPTTSSVEDHPTTIIGPLPSDHSNSTGHYILPRPSTIGSESLIQISDAATTVGPEPTAPAAVPSSETDPERIAWLSHAASYSFARAKESASARASAWSAHAAKARASWSKHHAAPSLA